MLLQAFDTFRTAKGHTASISGIWIQTAAASANESTGEQARILLIMNTPWSRMSAIFAT